MTCLLPLLGFLLGSIPFGLYIGRSQGIDIREHGSGNIGTTNVFRVVGKKLGSLCLVLDFLKGFIPVVIAMNLCRLASQEPMVSVNFIQNFTSPFPESSRTFVQSISVLTAFAAIMGHNYSPWVRFRGGKGIATSAGALAALMPAGVVILILIFVVVLKISRYVSVASIAAAASLPLLTLWGSWYHGKIADGTWNIPLFIFSLIAGFLAILKHRSNIQRLLAGTESKIGAKKKPQ